MQGPLSEELTILVLDTNILLEFLEVIQAFISEVEEQGLPVLLVIPGAVIYELDGQKNREGLSWFARRASTWLLKKVKERRSVKGQALDETCKPSGNWKKRDLNEFGSQRSNDSLIIDCCKYFLHLRHRRTFLCSKDKLLTVEAESECILTISPKHDTFCSRDIALALFGLEASRFRFSEYHPTYRESTVQLTQDDDGDDRMDIDDDSCHIPRSRLVHPSHALDLLHLQVIEYFTGLFLDLVARIGGPEVQSFGHSNAVSRHAPGFSRKRFGTWGAVECLEYLETKKQLPRMSPRLDIFMTRPYEGVGARRGQDWSRRDWEGVLRGLGEIGDGWDEGSIREAVPALEVHMSRVFAMPLRPTGL